MGRHHDREISANWPWPIRSSASCRIAWSWPSSGLGGEGRLAEKAGHSLPTLMESPAVKPEAFNAAKTGREHRQHGEEGEGWIISASGGVAINSWAIANKAKADGTVRPIRAKAIAAAGTANWWWN